MQTDIPLKRLTLLRPADLLPLLGMPHAQVISVESLELPSSAKRLDNVLRLRSIQGQEYLHVIEWQGYHDPGMLWRFASYLAWLGQRDPNQAITGTLIYLTPAVDVGDTLRQEVDGQPVLEWPVPCIRLWEQDAPTALASGNLGLMILSPLMHNATEALIEQAIESVLRQTALPQQADLLSILGVFAEPLIAHQRFVNIIGRERLMASDLLTYLMEEKLAEVEAERATERATLIAERATERATMIAERDTFIAELEAERALRLQQEAEKMYQSQNLLEEAVIARFPEAPITLVHDIRRVTDTQRLQRLIVDVIRAADLAAFERALMLAADPEAS